MKRINKFWLPDSDRHFISHFEQYNGFQLERLEVALRYVKNWGMAIDGGAHVGSWAKKMGEQFGRVYAFEPAEDTFECLARNVWADRHIHAVNAALGDQAGFVNIAWEEKHRVSGNTGARYVHYDRDGEVQAVTIDSFNFKDVGLIKLDVEGAELLALKGAHDTIMKYKPVIFIEVKKGFAERFDSDMQAPIRYLKELGAHEATHIKADHIFVFD